jgi:arabinofuranosyltransferase
MGQAPMTEATRKDAEAPIATSFRAWLGGAPLPRETHLLLGLAAPAVALALNMWHVRAFTIDDAYISFRYARNLAHGLGLVYNAGEKIEGYTNFLWTLILAGGIRVGLDPVVLAKVLGALCAFGALGMVYLLSSRFRPFTNFPCVATWLLASTIVFSGYSVFGLETSLFVFLVLAGTELFFREESWISGAHAPFEMSELRHWKPVPYSGLVFGLAGLTRPEAPLFVGVPVLLLGLRAVSLRNVVRGALFLVPVGIHILWRHAYYGKWIPNTAYAKTGNLQGQIDAGWAYVQSYSTHAGPLLWLALFGVAVGVVTRRREIISAAMVSVFFVAYVVSVGGDWMPFFRVMAPFEPFCFLLVDVGARAILDRRERAPALLLMIFGVAMVVHRIDAVRDAQRSILHNEDRFWRMAAGGTAKWLVDNGEPGEIAIGDIGYVGYVTDYPVLDLLGLVDPVISKLPGGYTRKVGPGFNERFFEKSPKYFLLISSSMDCQKPSVPASQVIYNDRRFKPRYEVAGKVPLDGGFAWCIYRKKTGS